MQNHLTLSQLQKLVKATLDEAFALPVWVSAEIAEIKINYSGHCYLELVEKGGDNGVPLSQARAVIWRTAYARIAGYFEAETGQRLAAGIRILPEGIPALGMILPVGGFLTLACVIAAMQYILNKPKKGDKKTEEVAK